MDIGIEFTITALMTRISTQYVYFTVIMNFVVSQIIKFNICEFPSKLGLFISHLIVLTLCL